MTNVVFREKFRGMVEHKQRQSRDNLDFLFAVLDELGKPASSNEIEEHTRKRAVLRAKDRKYEIMRAKYESGDISCNAVKEFEREKTKNMSLRTIQRMLTYCVSKGFVEKRNTKYLLSITGKRELKFRQFAQAYGTASLNDIMDLNFPTLNNLDKNLGILVKIFGVYVVYALIEATRLIVAKKSGEEEHWHSRYFEDASNFKDGKFREGKLVNTWIKDIFDPWHMLNLFLTAISNSADDSKVPANSSKREEIVIRQRIRQYENENFHEIVDVDSIRNMHRRGKITPSTLDLMFQRISEISQSSWINKSQSIDIISKYFHQIKIRSHYDDTLLYEPDSERIEKLKNSLKKQYPFYSKRLQKINESFYSK